LLVEEEGQVAVRAAVVVVGIVLLLREKVLAAVQVLKVFKI